MNNKNSINIPRDIFDKVFKYKGMTNQFMTSLPEEAEELSNAEVEKNEYVQNKGQVKKALGDTHEDGGIKTVLEQGDRVLSNHLKIGAKLSKQLNKEFELKTKATDTYANVLDKYLKKIGHTEATSEMEESIKKLDKQNKTVKHKETLALNQEYLMGEIKEYGDELDSYEQSKTEMFSLLFQAQEDSKVKNDNKYSHKYQKGGNFYENYNPYFSTNPSYEGKLKEWQNKQFYKPEYELGDVNQTATRFKELADNSGVAYTEDDFKNMDSLNKLAGRIQQKVIQDKPTLAKHYGLNIYPTRQGLQQLVDKKIINPKEYGIKLIDGKVPRGSYDTLSQEQQDKMQAKIQGLPKKEKEDYAVTNFNDNLAYFRGIMTKEQYLPKDEFNKFVDSNKDSLVGDGYYSTKQEGVYVKPYTNNEENSAIKITSGDNAPPNNNNNIPLGDNTTTPAEKRKKASILFPERYQMMPDFLAPMKFQPKIYSGERVEISPEQALSEINRGRLATQQQIDQLPDSQKAATLASMDANNAQVVSKVISETSRYNAQAQERESYEEAQARTRQSISDQQAAAQYQQLMGRELEGYRNDLNNMYNKMYEDQYSKWMAINQFNRLNAFNPEIQFDGQNYYVTEDAAKTTESRLRERLKSNRFK